MPDPAPIPNPQHSDAPAAPRDMSQYIRTFAKDVAEITNQPAPVIPKPAVPSPALVDDGVVLPEVDASPVNRPDGIVKEFPQEEVTLKKEDSAGIFTRLSDVLQPERAETDRNKEFVPPVTQSIPADELRRREEVLARLRAKISSSMIPGAAPSPAPPPQPIPPPAPFAAAPPPPPPPPLVPQYVPPPAPPPYEPSQFSPFPPAPPQPAPLAPAPSSIPSIGVVPLDTNASPLHTYTSDFADRIDREQASTFSVLAAQSDAGLRSTTTVSKRRGIVPVVLAVLLIVVGIGGIFAAYHFVNTGEKTEITLGVPSLIFADEKMELLGPDYRLDLANAATQPLVEGNILITYVTVASSTSLGLSNAPQPGGALIRLLNLGAPDILLRNVDLSSTVGVVSAGGQTSPFFIFRVNSYERTFAGMLGWENRMLNNLEPLYPQYEMPVPEPVATTTATTTTAQVPSLVALPSAEGFVDGIVSNIDVRTLKDGAGRTLVMYGYSDKETLIIARDEAAFATLVARLAATRGQ